MNLIALISSLAICLCIYYVQDKLLKVYETYNVRNFVTGNIEESSLTFDTILEIHSKVQDDFSYVRDSIFFKNLKVNLDTECKLTTQNMICQYPSCGVCQCEEDEIPLPWKQEENELDLLDKKIDDTFYKWVEKYENKEKNWIWESEIESKNGIYVNLMKNIEAYTGYQGRHIWNAIYNENCFANNLHKICQEEKILYTIISGLHSNINIHLSYNYLDLEAQTSKISRNMTMLNERVVSHRNRLNNLFFLYGTLLKTFYKANRLINKMEIRTMNNTDDDMARARLRSIFNTLGKYKGELNVTDVIVEKLRNYKNLDDIKLRFRNISEIIDCVSCQKCKLHGKLQIYGLATMFKVLFEADSGKNFKRNEIISFVNLVDKVGRSIHHLLEMKQLRYEPEWFSLTTKTLIVVLLTYYCLMLIYFAIKA